MKLTVPPFFNAFFPLPQLQVRELDFGTENMGRKRPILAQHHSLKAIDADQCEVSPHFLNGVSERSPPSPPLSAVMLTEKSGNGSNSTKEIAEKSVAFNV